MKLSEITGKEEVSVIVDALNEFQNSVQDHTESLTEEEERILNRFTTEIMEKIGNEKWNKVMDLYINMIEEGEKK